MAEICIVYDFECCLDPVVAFEPEIGKNLCRVKIDTHSTWEILKGRGKYRGYRKEILTENLTERDKTVLICTVCEGIMKEACLSSSGEQLCSCCELRGSCFRCWPNLSVRKMINSLKCSCPLIERGCEWLGNLESCENHLDTCSYVYEKCELECGVVLIREELRIHEKEKCPNRIVKCEHCMKDFKSCELNGHLEKCPMMKVSCDLKCGAAMCREDMEQHLYHHCGMVQDTCNLGCGVELTRDELKLHEKDTCVQRIMKCEHCFAYIRYWNNPKHLKECPRVRVACELCSVEICREYMTEHIEKYCPEEMVECPFVKYKCMTRTKRKDMDKHLEEKETKHLGLKLTVMEDLITKQSEEITKQSYQITKQSDKINEQSEEITKLHENNITDLELKLTTMEDLTTKQGDKISIQRVGITELREGFTIQHEKINKQSIGINKQSEKVAKLSEEINKQSMGINKQSEKITKQNEEITKQNEEITKLHEKIEKLNKENEKQDKEIKTEIASTSQRLDLLYYIYDPTEIIWRIDNVTDLMKYLRTMSVLYHVAGYRFSFEFGFNGELHIVFPETTSKYDRPFIAKCHIVFSSRYWIHCGVIEVKQKELMRGCDRIITTISSEDVYKYSEPISPGDTKRGLTLRIFLTMQ